MHAATGTLIETDVLRRRLPSWGWDYLVVLAWLAVVLVVIGVPQLIGWLDLAWIWSQPVTADVAITVLTVVPYLAYLIVTEAGSARATWGKRRTGLVVAHAGGDVAPWRGRAQHRKVLPWQLGHMSAMRFAFEEEVSAFAVTLVTASMVLLALVVVPILLGGRGLHDRAAGTDVRLDAPRFVTQGGP